MKERRSRASKVHFQHNGNHRTLCGLDGRTTYMVNSMTCRVCMFHYLAESASWARRFLDDLRGKPTVPRESERDKNLRERGYHLSVGPDADRFQGRSPMITLEYIDASLGGELAGAGQGHAVTVPAGATAPVDGKVKGLGDGFARAFGQQCSPEKAVSYFLPFQSTGRATVQPVVEGGGPATDAIGVKPGQVTEQAGDAGQVGDKAGGDFQAPE